MTNCHFVTESLVKPWELKPGSLRYYDFERDRICKGFTRRLFAQEGTNTAEVEKWLSDYIEAPIGRVKKLLLEQPEAALSSWQTFRAYVLYLLAQAPRYKKAMLAPHPLVESYSHDDLSTKDESFIDGLVTAWLEDFKLVRLCLGAGHVFFFPETGFFQFPVQDANCATGWSFAFGFPISPAVCVAMLPIGFVEGPAKALHEVVHAYSVGLNSQCRRVLIPKIVLDHVSEEDVCVFIRQQRERAVETVTNVHSIRDLVQKMTEALGMKLFSKLAVKAAGD